jgi:hypothetical protein
MTVILSRVSSMASEFKTYLPAIVAAIPVRRSIRNYATDSLPDNLLEQLEKFVRHMYLPFPHEGQITIISQQIEKSIFYYPSPRDYAAFIAPKTIIDQAKLGFAGELFILFAVSLGLSTCWMGHFNTRLANQAVFNNSDGDEHFKIFCATPLGTQSQKKGLLTTLSARLFSKKKGVAEHLTADSIPLATIPEPILTALDLACKAPSALNNQCWYSSVKKTTSGHEIVIGKPRGYRHIKWPYVNIDVGTAAAHFWAGMENNKHPTELRVWDDGESVHWGFLIEDDKGA